MNPRADEREFWDGSHLTPTIAVGIAAFEPIEGLTERERAQLARERRERLARKRQPGFTATWPEDTPKGASK